VNAAAGRTNLLGSDRGKTIARREREQPIMAMPTKDT
jgi:hypothetical protein